MREVFKLVVEDKIAKWAFMLSGIFLILESIIIAFFYFSLPPLLPLFNQMPWGEERLGAKIEIFLPIILASIFFILNFFLISSLHKNLPLLSRIVSITTILVVILSFFFTMRTLQLII